MASVGVGGVLPRRQPRVTGSLRQSIEPADGDGHRSQMSKQEKRRSASFRPGAEFFNAW